jgi:hypothetical protein
MVEDVKKLTIKERIEKDYKSINNFVEANYQILGISRTYLYALLNKETCNPSVGIMLKLSEITKIPYEEISNEYCMRYRNKQSSSEHSD